MRHFLFYSFPILFFALFSFGVKPLPFTIKSNFHPSFFDTSIRLQIPQHPPFADPIVTSDSASCIIPFKRVGNLILITAKAGKTEGNFILDTGAPGLILNMAYFRDLPQTEEAADESGGITGGVGGSSPTFLDKFNMGPINYAKVNADRINLGHLENNKGVKILGLLGMQLFKKFEMIIDYQNNQINLYLITKKEGKNFKSFLLKDTSAYQTFDISIFGNKLLTKGQIGNKKLTFVIDTGAESNVIDSRLPDTLFSDFNITRRVKLSGAGSDKIDALYGEMPSVKVGSLNFNNLPLIVTNLEKMCFAYDRCIDGMLGFDFLSLHKIGFNFIDNKMFIWKQ